MSSALLTDTASDLAARLGAVDAGERLRILAKEFPGEVLLSSSFGLQAAVMLKLVKDHAPEIPVIFVDTGYHFAETYRYVEELKQTLGLDVKTYAPAITPAHQEALYGKLWEQGDDALKRYAVFNKIEPMDRALREHGTRVWLSGIRRKQSGTRAERPFAEAQGNTLKVYPIVDWTDEQVEAYYAEHNLPQHPLKAEGYVTMGDWHSTRVPEAGESAEETRFGGSKYECGLHLDSGSTDFQI